MNDHSNLLPWDWDLIGCSTYEPSEEVVVVVHVHTVVLRPASDQDAIHLTTTTKVGVVLTWRRAWVMHWPVAVVKAFASMRKV